MNKNVRKYKRINFNVSVDLKHESRLQKLYSRNISSGGIYISAKELVPIGKKVVLFFEIKEIGKRFRAEAKVVHHHRYESFEDESTVKSEQGMGLEFVDLTDEEKKLIEEYVLGKDLKQGD